MTLTVKHIRKMPRFSETVTSKLECDRIITMAHLTGMNNTYVKCKPKHQEKLIRSLEKTGFKTWIVKDLSDESETTIEIWWS